MQWFLLMVPTYLVVGWIATTWIRAKYGYPLAGGAARRDDERASRDELIARLEARVRVLERIATDRRERLREEIDGLGVNSREGPLR